MILYFSGTGNSRRAALKLAEQLQDQAFDMGSCLATGAALHSEAPYVVVCPVYAWQMAGVAADFLRRSTLAGSSEIYYILTCGSSMGNADAHCARLSAEIGKAHKGTAQLVMPENYIILFKATEEEEIPRILHAADRRVEKLSEIIRRGEAFAVKKASVAARFLSGPVNSGFSNHYVGDKKFRVTQACTGCGLCARLCPLADIRLTDGKPVWQGSCTHCMACISHCPAEAIEYGKRSVGKRRYRCPEN